MKALIARLTLPLLLLLTALPVHAASAPPSGLIWSSRCCPAGVVRCHCGGSGQLHSPLPGRCGQL